jgi:hypothetical protein
MKIFGEESGFLTRQTKETGFMGKETGFLTPDNGNK